MVHGRLIMTKMRSDMLMERLAPLMVVVVALMGDRALAVEMPKDFQGKWCTDSNTLKDHWVATKWPLIIIPKAQTAGIITVLSRSLPRR